jgi:hypothetical protein
VRQMMVQPLPMSSNHLGVVVVEYAPRAGSLPHSHSGPVLGYVLPGRVEIGIEHSVSRSRTLKATSHMKRRAAYIRTRATRAPLNPPRSWRS